MKYRIKRGSKKMIMFMLTGVFLVISSSYQLFSFLQAEKFIFLFPGDWDKPLGILVGIFLIVRSLKFIKESRDLFIEISKNYLVYRTNNSESIHKILISNIEKIYEKNNEIITETKDNINIVIIDFNKFRLRDDTRNFIKKSLIKLNNKINS